MDKFFTQKTCDRCGGSLAGGRIMSILNTDCLCLECKEKEKEDPRYKEAAKAEIKQVRKGNYNYEGLLQEQKITDKLLEQIKDIRASGKYNMFDLPGIQREAFERDYFELVTFLEESKKDCLNFIFTGQR